MHVGKPYESLFPGVESSVLRVLAESGVPRSTREIARMAGKSHPAVGAVLSRFENQGLVRVQRTTSSHLFTLNQHHVASPAVMLLAGLRTELFDRVRRSVGSWDPPPVHVSVFGSAARGDGDEQSDIDLLVVRPDRVPEGDSVWQGQIDDLALDIHEWTGNHAGISDISADELGKASDRHAPILEAIQSDGITLFGARVDELAGRAR